MSPSVVPERFGGSAAIFAGIAGILYSAAFFIVQRSDPTLGAGLSAAFLALTGLASTAVLVGLYGRVRAVEPGLAFWAVLLGVTSAIGRLVHGGYDLANLINPPPGLEAELPSQIDPRGLLSFGLTGVALLAFSWLISRSAGFPRGLAALGTLSGLLLIVLYVGRLVVLTPTSPVIVVPAIVNGFVVGPAWYIWVGLVLLRLPEPAVAASGQEAPPAGTPGPRTFAPDAQ